MKNQAGLFCSFLLLLTVNLFSCTAQPGKINKPGLKGLWHLNTWTAANNLRFDDYEVSVDNSVDTIYTLQYTISDDTLITGSGPGPVFRNRIIKLTKDSLVLNGFNDLKGIRRYSRSRTGY